MKYKIGLVGLPNVGKSSIFNLLNGKVKSTVASFPYSTIQPIYSLVEFPNSKLDELEKLFLWLFRDSLYREKLDKKYESFEFLDLAGIVPLDGELDKKKSDMGASFLSYIRAVDLIVIVIRTFSDESVESQLNTFLEENPKMYNSLIVKSSLKEVEQEFKDKSIKFFKKSQTSEEGEGIQLDLDSKIPLFYSEDKSFWTSLDLDKKDNKNINIVESFHSFEPILELKLVLLTLIKSDLDLIIKLLAKYSKDRKTFSKEIVILSNIKEELELKKFIPISMLNYFLALSEEQKEIINKLNLLSSKKVVILGNYGSSKQSLSKLNELIEWTRKYNFPFSSINLEGEEIYNLLTQEEEKKEMRQSIFLKNSSTEEFLNIIYKTLALKTFYTFKLEDINNRKYNLSNFSHNIVPVRGEIRAWSFKNNSSLKECVSQIHNELSNFFIAAHLIKIEDFIEQSIKGNSNLNIIKTNSKAYNLKGNEIVQIISSA
ncbi:DUF933 domain-containing protein [Mycoplasma parvum]|uniref:OBG-type G domain-containing protein n=1 Tax=Mycoplasma parvum str. Indiana TaxID=1403316 RepID=U5NCJ2_9MOLU|nr:DUF933 domain-containing protein [Mycoplasma parvum]AGX89301.1 hypothetical protein PRV_02875 [Mycoplasma parvum str. Indiana]